MVTNNQMLANQYIHLKHNAMNTWGAHTVKSGELGYSLGSEFNKHSLSIRYFIYTLGCIYNTLSLIVGLSNTLKDVNTCRVYRYTFKVAVYWHAHLIN